MNVPKKIIAQADSANYVTIDVPSEVDALKLELTEDEVSDVFRFVFGERKWKDVKASRRQVIACLPVRGLYEGFGL